MPRRSKILLGASFAYVLSPIDLLPEFIPVAGVLDDIFLVAFALNHLIERAGEEVVVEHWDGPQDLLGMIQSVLVDGDGRGSGANPQDDEQTGGGVTHPVSLTAPQFANSSRLDPRPGTFARSRSV